MAFSPIAKYVERRLADADIHISGTRPWDIQVKDKRFYRRLFFHGSLGLGESYMAGWWDCKAIDQCITTLLSSSLDKKKHIRLDLLFSHILSRLLNLQNKSKAFRSAQHHYDIGNSLYQAMLGKRMAYSCGYWKEARNLDEAQEAKLELSCKKLMLKPGMKVLDIGCVWGSFAKFAAEKYKVHVTGITVSPQQLTVAKQACKGLPVELRLQDYRDLQGKFDRIVSIGMFEHVGYKNYRTYMKVAHRCLADGGLFLLHTIGGNTSTTSFDPWLEKYIFPNAMLPSIKQIAAACEGLFVMEDWHSFGQEYDKTLMAWFANFDKSWHKLKADYDETFYRMWKYYLLVCAGSFRARRNQLWQAVLSKGGVEGGYNSIR